MTDSSASGGSSIGLANTGQGAQVTGTPAASKLAIHYASVSVGTISVSVNGQTVVKVNVHSSGALTGSFLYAIITIAIPANATVTISRTSGDVAANVDDVIVGNGDLGLPADIWNLPPFPVASGPYPADWKALGLAYTAPEWWRDAKLGAWAHWDPQSMPEQGDWYAYRMYQQGSADFNYQVSHFGDPSVYGYKDICQNWKIDQWDPNSLMALYVQMGAKFFMAMGSHHDNFACYDTKYQQWNAARVGVKQDLVATWKPLARSAGLRFGIGFHNTPARTWGQWMPIRYTSDAKGPYDALQTVLDGKGQWWQGMDPVDQDIGAWLKVNGEAVYGSRPFETMGDTTVAYTRNNRNVYATLFGWKGGAITLKALSSGGPTLGQVSKVEMLGSTAAVTFSQTAQGLTVTPGGTIAALPGISNQQLASQTRVLRITHDKGWTNDDDQGSAFPGWLRKNNLGTGDYNNDLTTSTTVGNAWTSTFTGTDVAVYAPKEPGDGKIEIQVDGQMRRRLTFRPPGRASPSRWYPRSAVWPRARIRSVSTAVQDRSRWTLSSSASPVGHRKLPNTEAPRQVEGRKRSDHGGRRYAKPLVKTRDRAGADIHDGGRL